MCGAAAGARAYSSTPEGCPPSPHHKLQVYRKYGKQMLVLTVHECKGLEFQVWLWNGLSCR
jgi:hypothetical protein